MRSDTPDRVLSPAKFRAAFPNATASARKRNADAHTRWLSDRFAPRFAGAAPPPVVLEVVGIVPSFKTQKTAAMQRSRKTGKWFARPLTKPEHKKWMAETVRSFVSQLRSDTTTGGGGTTTADTRHCWTVLLPQDDCWTQVPETALTAELCKPGQEGATITIERIA